MGGKGMKSLIFLLLFSTSAIAAPIDFGEAFKVLHGVQTKHITSAVDGQKYSWFKADLNFESGWIIRFCILMDMTKIQQLPAFPPTRLVNGYYTNAGTIDPLDDEWCRQ